MRPLLLAFLAGLASALAFEPIGAWPAIAVAMAGLLWLVERAPGLRSALARGWWFGFGQFALGLNWIATAFTYQAAMPAWLGWIAVLLLAAYLALFPAAAAGLAWRWRGGDRLVFVLLFAAAWIVTEYLRSVLFTGFPWNPAGIALLPSALSWPARWIGTYGLSGLVALLAGALLMAVHDETKRLFALAAALFGSVAAAWAFAAPAAEGEGPAARIVQPNIGQEQKWSPHLAERNRERLASLSRAGEAHGRPSLLIWPEAAVTEPLQDERRLIPYQAGAAETRRQVREVLRPGDLLLTGGITVLSRDGVQPSAATNSVFAIDSAGRILARYDKAHLVPFGEYLPMRPFLSVAGLSRLAPGELDFRPGPGPRTLDIPGIGAVGFQLCYEIVFSGQAVDPERRPAFLFNPSNDAWFGAWGPPQHLAQARMRALEEGLPVVRATPTGISAVIGADGRLFHALALGEAGTIDAFLPLPAPPTLFSRLGNAAPLGFALLLVAAAIAVRRKSV